MEPNNTYAELPIDALLTIAEGTVDSLRTQDDALRAHDADRIPEGVIDLLEALVTKTRPLLVADALDPAILQRPPIALYMAGEPEPDPTRWEATIAELQLNGFIVLTHVHLRGMDDDDTESMHALLRHKIDMADVVNIDNEDGVHEALLPFIEYAENTSTPVQYSENDR